MLQYSSQYYQDIEGEVIHIHHLATDINYKGIGARIIDEICPKGSKKQYKIR